MARRPATVGEGFAARPDAADRGGVLLAIVRAAIADALGQDPPDAGRPAEPWLDEVGAAFVTLTLDGALRGCIGTVEAYRPLGADVRANAVAAALDDPRFPALAPEDLPRIHLSVSVLSPLEPVPCTGESQAAAALRPGVDGVVLEAGGRRATFLPQVWEQLPEGSAFLKALKRKAGLPADPWDDSTRLYRYTVARYEEAP